MADYRFDEDFDGFMEDFGEPFESAPIAQEVIDAYKDKLPEQLFTYWRGVGACGFGDGLFWILIRPNIRIFQTIGWKGHRSKIAKTSRLLPERHLEFYMYGLKTEDML